MAQNLIPIISEYFKDQPEIAAVYLFGSFANGRQRPTSDLDIGLVFEHTDPKQISRALDHHFLALSRQLRKTLHLVAMNFAGEILLKQIFTKGRCILVNNPKTHSQFTMIAYSKIANFGDYHAQFKRSFTQTMMQ